MQGTSPFKNLNVPRAGGNLNPNITDLGAIIRTLLFYLFPIAGIGLLIYFVLAGLQMMTSKGDPKAMQMAQAKITSALIGFIILFLAFSLTKLIGQIFGLTVFSTIFK